MSTIFNTSIFTGVSGMRPLFIALASLLSALCTTAAIAQFPELDVLDGGTDDLDVTLVAGPRLVQIGGFNVETNVYSACQNQPGQISCTPPSTGDNPYGGVLLRVARGQHLKITLRNEMANADVDLMGLLTNLHTHGLIVRARGTGADDVLSANESGNYEPNSIGDFVFEATQPVGTAPMQDHGVDKKTERRFDILIPDTHPLGTYWFHPHVHEWAKEQVSGGMAGMIEVVDRKPGALPSHLCLTLDSSDPTKCAEPFDPVARPDIAVRNILLKDAQLLPTDTAPQTEKMLYDQDPAFCGGNVIAENTLGYCAGEGAGIDTAGKPLPFLGGRWVYSVNGAMLPSWTALPASSTGPGNTEILRIQNASANITYDLCFSAPGFPVNHNSDKPCDRALPFQVLSMDGVGFGSTAGKQPQFVAVDQLQRRVILMPGSRIELLLTPRDPANCSDAASASSCAQFGSNLASDFPVVLENLRYVTGGDNWPRGRLTTIMFKAAPGVQIAAVETANLLVAGYSPPAIPPRAMADTTKADRSARRKGLCQTGEATALGEKERRRIYFGIVNDGGTERFLLGHSIIGIDGTERFEGGATQVILRSFNMLDAADLCIRPSATAEVWQLVNISNEVHNFHIHQGKFSIVGLNDGVRAYTVSPLDQVNVSKGMTFADAKEQSSALVHDTIIVPRGEETKCAAADIPADTPTGGSFIKRVANGFDPKAPQYVFDPSGTCSPPIGGPPEEGTSDVFSQGEMGTAGWIEVSIPFGAETSLGKYVFHCHILEHEDLGMMSSIRVLTPAQLLDFP